MEKEDVHLRLVELISGIKLPEFASDAMYTRAMKAKPTERALFEAFAAHDPGFCKREMAACKTIFVDKRGRILAEFDKQNRLCLLERGNLYEAVSTPGRRTLQHEQHDDLRRA
jgi:hypothetical protein